jgi:hypothetical protein
MSISNLEKAKRAMKGEKEFSVKVERTISYEGTITAKSQQEAEELAIEAVDNGEWSESGDTGLEIGSSQEIKN